MMKHLKRFVAITISMVMAFQFCTNDFYLYAETEPADPGQTQVTNETESGPSDSTGEAAEETPPSDIGTPEPSAPVEEQPAAPVEEQPAPPVEEQPEVASTLKVEFVDVNNASVKETVEQALKSKYVKETINLDELEIDINVEGYTLTEVKDKNDNTQFYTTETKDFVLTGNVTELQFVYEKNEETTADDSQTNESTEDGVADSSNAPTRAMLRADSNTMVPVTIAGAGSNDGSKEIPLGVIAQNAPQFEGYEFVDARVGNTVITFLGEYNGDIFYTTQENELSGIKLNGAEITLNYQIAITRYIGIIYSYNDAQGKVTGVDQIEAGDSLDVLVEPNKGYKVAEVKANGNTIISESKVYTIDNITSDTEVVITFEKISKYTIVASNQKNLSVTFNGRTYSSANSLKSEYDAGSTGLTLDFETNESSQEFELNSLQISFDEGNYKNIRLPGDLGSGNTVTTELEDGTEVVVKENNSSGRIHQYTVTISNFNGIYGNIDLKINCKDVEYKEFWVQELNGIATLSIYGEPNSQWGGDKTYWQNRLPVGEFFWAADGKQDYYFFVKVLPGYDPDTIKLSVSGLENVSLRKLDNHSSMPYTAKNPAIRDGYTHYFKITTSYSNRDAKNVRIIISADYQKYNVKYDFDGGTYNGENSYSDPNTYSIVDSNDTFAIASGLQPLKDGSVLVGWNFNGHTYKTNEIFTLNEDNLSSVQDGTIAFKAVWEEIGSSEQVPYAIEFLFEQTDGTYKSDSNYPKKIAYGAPNGEIVIMKENAPEVDGYELDEESIISTIINPDGSTVIKLKYNLIRDVLKYNANAEDATGSTGPTKGLPNTEVTVEENGFIREGYKFKEWNTKKDGTGISYNPGKKYTLTDEDNVTPKGNNGIWALINLIAAIVTVILGLFLLLSKRHRNDEDEDEEERQARMARGEEKEQEQKRGWICKVLGVIVAIASVVFFILTEDMSLPMALTDKWTIWMVVIAIVELVLVLVGRHWKDVDDEDQEQQA